MTTDPPVPDPDGPVTLRRFTLADVQHLVDLDADPEVTRFLFRIPPSPDEVEHRILPTIVADYARRPGFGRWAAELTATGAFIGWFSLHVGDDPSRPELGYRLRREHWGRGLASGVGRVLVDWAFAHPGVEVVTAGTMAVNRASRRVMEKCGLHHVGTDHLVFDDPLPGTDQGEVRYELTRATWLARRPA